MKFYLYKVFIFISRILILIFKILWYVGNNLFEFYNNYRIIDKKLYK